MTDDMVSISNKVKFRYFYSIFRQFCRLNLPFEIAVRTKGSCKGAEMASLLHLRA